MNDFHLFSRGNLYTDLEQRKLSLRNEVEKLESNYLLNVSEGDFCKHLVDKYLLESPIIHGDKKSICDQSEVDIDVSQSPTYRLLSDGQPIYKKVLQITIAIPFSGDAELFNYSPSTSVLLDLKGGIVGSELHLIYQSRNNDGEELRRRYEHDIDGIRRNLDCMAREIEIFNKSLEDLVKKIVSERKQKLLNDQHLVSSLGIPIKRRSDLPQTYTVPIFRKKPKIERPNVTTASFKPEPSLATEEYENILKIINNMALVMERSPRTFSKLSEEEIRDHFLMHLNGHYEGQATGETFNCSGKTDILIRVEGRNIFIAECKFWRGEKEFLETIDQLLGYTSWRDTKTAILLFNRNKEFSAVLQKIPDAIRPHSCFISGYGATEETMFRYIFHQPGDINRRLVLTVMAFDIPC